MYERVLERTDINITGLNPRAEDYNTLGYAHTAQHYVGKGQNDEEKLLATNVPERICQYEHGNFPQPAGQSATAAIYPPSIPDIAKLKDDPRPLYKTSYNC